MLKFHGILYDLGYLPAIVTSYCDNGNVLEYLRKAEKDVSEILGIVCTIILLGFSLVNLIFRFLVLPVALNTFIPWESFMATCARLVKMKISNHISH